MVRARCSVKPTTYGRIMQELPIIKLIFLTTANGSRVSRAAGQQKFILATNKGNDSFEANDVTYGLGTIKVKITGQFILQNQ